MLSAWAFTFLQTAVFEILLRGRCKSSRKIPRIQAAVRIQKDSGSMEMFEKTPYFAFTRSCWAGALPLHNTEGIKNQRGSLAILRIITCYAKIMIPPTHKPQKKKKQSLLQTKHCNNMVIFVTVTTPKNETLSQHLPTHY